MANRKIVRGSIAQTTIKEFEFKKEYSKARGDMVWIFSDPTTNSRSPIDQSAIAAKLAEYADSQDFPKAMRAFIDAFGKESLKTLTGGNSTIQHQGAAIPLYETLVNRYPAILVEMLLKSHHSITKNFAEYFFPYLLQQMKEVDQVSKLIKAMTDNGAAGLRILSDLFLYDDERPFEKRLYGRKLPLMELADWGPSVFRQFWNGFPNDHKPLSALVYSPNSSGAIYIDNEIKFIGSTLAYVAYLGMDEKSEYNPVHYITQSLLLAATYRDSSLSFPDFRNHKKDFNLAEYIISKGGTDYILTQFSLLAYQATRRDYEQGSSLDSSFYANDFVKGFLDFLSIPVRDGNNISMAEFLGGIKAPADRQDHFAQYMQNMAKTLPALAYSELLNTPFLIGDDKHEVAKSLVERVSPEVKELIENPGITFVQRTALVVKHKALEIYRGRTKGSR